VDDAQLEAPVEEGVEIEAAIEEPAEAEDVEAVTEVIEEEVEEPEPEIPAIDDLATPLVAVEQPKVKERKKVVVVTAPTTLEAPKEDARGRQRGKQLEFDEKRGQVVVKRKHKSSRRRPEWEQMETLDELGELTVEVDADEITEDEI
jgi:hypothetical protein